MIERVARTFFGHWKEKPRIAEDLIAAAWADLAPAFKEPWLTAARNAIEAMRDAALGK